MSMSDQRLIEIATAVGRIEGKLDSLLGPEGRVTKLENAQTRHWWFSYVISPTLFVMYATARKFGVHV